MFLWSYLLWSAFLSALLIDLFVPKKRAIKLPGWSEHSSTTKYRPTYLIRTQAFKMLTFLFLFHHWGCLIQDMNKYNGKYLRNGVSVNADGQEEEAFIESLFYIILKLSGYDFGPTQTWKKAVNRMKLLNLRCIVAF